MSYIKEITSLSKFAKSLSDYEISLAVSEYQNKRYSQLTQASHEMNDAMLTEWGIRHGNKPVPKVIPESAMIFQEGSNNSCKFIMHLL